MDSSKNHPESEKNVASKPRIISSSKLPIVVTVIAGLLSSTVSIVALSNAFGKKDKAVQPMSSAGAASEPGLSQSLNTPQKSASNSAQESVSRGEDLGGNRDALRENFKEFWATLTLEERAHFKSMTASERKAFRAQHEKKVPKAP